MFGRTSADCPSDSESLIGKSHRSVAQVLCWMSVLVAGAVVDGSQNTRDFHFPQESRQKFQNMPQITPFQITLSLQVIRSENTPDFHLALRQQRKKFQIFHQFTTDVEFGD